MSTEGRSDSDTLKNALNALNSSSASAALLKISLQFLLDPAQTEYQSELGNLAGEYQLSSGEFKLMAQAALVFLNEALHSGSASTEFLHRQLTGLAVDTDVIQLFCSAWEAETKKISQHLVLKIVAKNRLVDLDWSFGVTASSDELDHVGKTYLQLKLTIDSDQDGLKTHFIEMGVDQFYHFLASLEKCQTLLDFVSPR